MLKARLFAILKKEFLQIIRDPSSLVIAFIMPVALILLFGYSLSNDTSKVTICVVTQDYSSSNIISLIDYFIKNKSINIKKITNNKSEINKLLKLDEVEAVLFIPDDFDRELLTKKIANINIITDATEPNMAIVVDGYIRQIFALWVDAYNKQYGYKSNSIVNINSRFWYNNELKSSYSFSSGSIAIVLSITCTLLTALVIAREWERGTMESLIASPLSIYEIILSKTLPYVFLGICSLFLSFLCVILCFKIPFHGSFFVFLLSGVCYIFAATSIGLFISTYIRTQFNAAQISILISFLPAMMLSGLIYEIDSVPVVIKMISYIFPTIYFVDVIKTIFLVGNVWNIILKDIFAIILINIIIMYAIIKKTKKLL